MTIYPLPVASAVFMGGLVVRRKRLDPQLKAGLPLVLADFVPSEWPGGSEYQRYEAWRAAREDWAEKYHPEGVDGLPWWHGVVPDQPWDEVVL